MWLSVPMPAEEGYSIDGAIREMENKNSMKTTIYIEIPIEVEYDFSPMQEQTYHQEYIPGSAEANEYSAWGIKIEQKSLIEAIRKHKDIDDECRLAALEDIEYEKQAVYAAKEDA